MKIAILISIFLAAELLQSELLDLNPLIQIMADAPVYGLFVWLFLLQQKQNDKLINALVKIATKKQPDGEDAE